MVKNRKQYITGILLVFLILTIGIISAQKLRIITSVISQRYMEFMELRYIEIKYAKSYDIQRENKIKLPDLVVHAGGSVGVLTGTNSLEALNASYEKGFRFIELDFNWTTDNHLVVIHDWEGSVKRLFSVDPKDYSLSEFRKFKMIKNLTQITLDDLVRWLDKHPDTFIITDIKRYNINGLKHISQKYPHISNQIIPQIYKFTEYYPVRKLGFDNLIFTLYASNYNDDILLKFLQRHRVLAVTMPINKAETNLPLKLKSMNIFVYTHTVNQKEAVNRLKANGVDGFYTDLLEPRT